MTTAELVKQGEVIFDLRNKLRKAEAENAELKKVLKAQVVAAVNDRIAALEERLEKCEAALRKARMLLVSEGNPDEDREMIAEIDDLLGDAACAALEGE